MYVILRLFDLYRMLLIVYILMSWFPGARQSQIGELISKVVEPYLAPFRKIIPPLGGLDFSVLIAIFCLSLAREGIIYLWIMLV